MVRVNRFDARLLLSELPQSHSTPVPGSPTPSSSGWSDLPSDTEDAFFLSSKELDDVRYTKRQRQLEEARQERLAALRRTGDIDDSNSTFEKETWGGSDEEPDTTQLVLMERTATHLYASPDRVKLKARILANHGADTRFGFLRGRWRRTWERVQAKVVAAAAAEREREEKEKGGKLMMGLEGYGDSDSSSSNDEDEGGAENDEDEDAAEGSGGSRGVQIVSDVLSKGLSVKVNGTPWQRVILKMDDVLDEAIIILYGLMPSRQYDVELGILPGEASVRGQITTGALSN